MLVYLTVYISSSTLLLYFAVCCSGRLGRELVLVCRYDSETMKSAAVTAIATTMNLVLKL
jgi:hypothetical protein